MARTDPDNITCTKLLAPAVSSISARCSTLIDDEASDAVRRDAAGSLMKELDMYLAEPTLLDGILPTLVQSLTASFTVENLEKITATAADESTSIWALPYTVLQVAQKVRGAKLVLKHYPHSVGDLDTVIDLILFLNDTHGHGHEYKYWRIHEVLFCWLANVCLVPFPLVQLVKSPDILPKLEEIAFRSLNSSQAHFLARLSTRPDCDDILKSVMKKSVEMIPWDSSMRHNSLNLLAKIFKIGQRNLVLPYASTVLEKVTYVTEGELKHPSTLDMHLATKLAQRIALAYLPPRVCSWRYQRGSRFLFGAHEAGEDIRKDSALSKSNRTTRNEEAAPEEESLDISAEAQEGVEVALGVVLGSLENRDAIVRWSGAKGVGRIVSRLDPALGSEVISHVIDTFQRNPNDEASWNGACLSLAELLRRGLILPNTQLFKSMVDILETACNFDIRRGAHSVGEHVRDAACYVVWALARAYNSDHMEQDDIDRIIHAVLKVALFDREVHCRRAASAALQECVGRMPSTAIRDGIFVITTADFFALGDRTAAYLKIAPKIARAGDGIYLASIVAQLELKLSHWDYNMRLLAAKGLQEQLENDTDDIIVSRIIPNLIARSMDVKADTIHRHGCILGVAKIITASSSVSMAIKKEDLNKLINIWKCLDEDGCFNGRSAVLLEAAVCELIQTIADTIPSVYESSVGGEDHWANTMQFLERCLPSGNARVQKCADSAFKSVLRIDNNNDNKARYLQAEEKYSELMMIPEPVVRQRGFVLAAGWFHSERILGNLKNIAKDAKDVEVRRNAVISLGRFECSVLMECRKLNEVLEVLEGSMADYTVDDRGDVGSWIREAAMESAACIIERLPRESIMGSKDGNGQGIVGISEGIVRQCLEKIDRTRFAAAQVLDRIILRFNHIGKKGEDGNNTSVWEVFEAIISTFKFDTTLPNDKLERKEMLKERFLETDTVFARGIALLNMNIAKLHSGVLRGLIASAGGKGHQNKDAMNALLCCERPKLVEEISDVLIAGKNQERLYISALNVMYTLLLYATRDNMDIDIQLVVKRVRANWKGRMRDIKHMAAATSVLGELVGSVQALEALMVVLGCGVPRIRRIAAETIYLVLLEKPIEEIDMHTAMEILLDTRWENLKVDDARATRNELCDALGVKKVVAVSKKK